jgi:hypothetical protein
VRAENEKCEENQKSKSKQDINLKIHVCYITYVIKQKICRIKPGGLIIVVYVTIFHEFHFTSYILH